MKRSELTVGTEIAYQDSVRYGRPIKAVIVAVEPYGKNPSWYGNKSKPKFTPITRGNGVLVLMAKYGETASEYVVPLAHLRGPWELYKAEFDAQKQAEREQIEAVQRMRDETRRHSEALVKRATDLGIRVDCPKYGNEDGKIVINTDQFEELLALAERT